MARTFTLALLRTRAKALGDFDGPNSPITDTQWNVWLSEAYTELYDLLIESGLSYFESEQTINTVAGTASYAVDAIYYGTVRLDCNLAANTWQRVALLPVQEVPRVALGTASIATHYRIVGSNLVLYPTPSSVRAYRHVYVPAAADLTTDAQAVDGVSGWEELIVLNAVIKARIREESSTADLERRKAELRERIEMARTNRLVAQPMRISDESDDDEIYDDPADWRIYRG